MIDTLEKKECTGCKACGDICPTGAIFFETDQEGFWYPHIDANKCTKCGLCKKTCPSCNYNKLAEKMKPEVYAAWSRDFRIRTESTSGGLFWEIAIEFVKNGGVVAGCKWGEDWKSAEHYIATDEEGLIQLRGSKYIQSDTAGIYKQIKQYIVDGKKVLFCGTPCQNAALKLYLQDKDENVFYLDFICRSINSPLAFKKYVEELEKKYSSKVTSVHLKNKKKGWQSLASQVCFENGQESLRDRHNDYWVNGFLHEDLFTRDSCMDCKYRCIPRKTADITIGDFWGIQNQSQYDMYRGISVVLVNSTKGKELLEACTDNLQIVRKSIEEVKPGNFALYKNPVVSINKQKFFELIKKDSFSVAVSKLTGMNYDEEIRLTPEQELANDIIKYAHRGLIDEKLYMHINFECKNVIRRGKAKIIPYKNTVLDIHDKARVILEGDLDFEIGTNLLYGSKAETLVRLRQYSTTIIHHGGYLFYGTTLEVKENSIFDTGYFSANTGSVIIVSKKVTFGEDVMIGRNVMIYDSDFHQMLDEEGNQCNSSEEVVIEDHVWLTANININKGVHIGQGSIIANQTVIIKDIPRYSIVAGQSVGRIINSNAKWSRNAIDKYHDLLSRQKSVLFGYGIEGKKFYEKYKDNIYAVIDNYVTDEIVEKFDEFVMNNRNGNDYVWIIASPNHYDEIYSQIRERFDDCIILPYTELQEKYKSN